MASKILIVDDHEAVRRGLRHMLEKSPQWQVIGEAADGREAVEKTRRLNPDLIVMDFLMPNMNGLDAAREITKLPHHPPILMLTMYMSRQLVEEARRAGIRAALHKSETGKIITGTSLIAAGNVFSTCQVMAQYFHGRTPRPAISSARLLIEGRGLEFEALPA